MNMKVLIKINNYLNSRDPPSPSSSFPPAAIKHFMDLEIVDYGWLHQFYLPLNEM